MPIDFEALVAPFRTAYFLQWRSITESMRKLAEWLTKRLKSTVERERDTRSFQIFAFSGDALSVWIDSSQHGALGPEGEPPPAGFGDAAAAPFIRFWRGLLLSRSMVEAEGALPGILAALAKTVNMIVDSLDRFKTPDKSIFDTGIRRQWQDLFGEAGLFFRAINDPAVVDQVKAFSQGGIRLIDVINKHFPSEKSPTEKTGSGLIDLTRWITGGILIVPLIWQLVAQVASTVNLVIRLKLLDWATSIQNEIFGLRRDAIDFLYVTLFGMGRTALEWVVVTQSDLLLTIDIYTSFAKAYLGELLTWLSITGKEIKRFADGLVHFLYGLAFYLIDLEDMDIGGALTYGAVPFTLGDLFDPDKVGSLQTKVSAAIEAIKAASDQDVVGPLIRWKSRETLVRLEALKAILPQIGVTPQIPDEAAPPDLSGLEAPNIYESFFGGTTPSVQAAALRAQLTSAGPALTANVDKIFDAGIGALTTVSETLSKAGASAASVGSAARYREVALKAAATAESVFGADAARDALVRRKDPLAQAFESWLARSGFEFVGRVLPGYVAEMIDFWKKEAAKNPAERPTSPHIVARRAQIGRVRMPRMVIRISEERELDKVLAVEVGDRVRFGVAQAFGVAMDQQGAGA